MLSKEKSIKELLIKNHQKAGRNNRGRITVFHRGGGHKRHIRLVDFKRELAGVPAKIMRIEYDPNRNAHLALVCYTNGILSYIINTDGVKVGDYVMTSDGLHYGSVIKREGSVFKLGELNIGEEVHSLEIEPDKGAQLLRSAGSSGLLVKKDSKYALIRLKSGEERLFLLDCRCVVGKVSNGEVRNKKLYKAGQSRWLSKRPVVRGVAMNPVDHPHGGRTKGGRCSVTPWGRLTKGKPTRSIKRKNNLIVKRARD